MPLYLAVKQTGTSYRSDNTVVCIPFIVHECLNFLSDKSIILVLIYFFKITFTENLFNF